MLTYFTLVLLLNVLNVKSNYGEIDIIDLTKPCIWNDLADYYTSMEKNREMCLNCGSPRLGTAMHLEHTAGLGSIHPAIISPEYLLTRLIVVDVSALAEKNDNFVLTLDLALQWSVLQQDPREPTLLLFKFGWKEEDNTRIRNCVCKIPGISYELAEYISLNMSHVIGVATDAPTLESEETRYFSTRTVSRLLGQSGVYMIENVHVKRLPEFGCLTIAMPLKLVNTNYVPTRLTAFCPMTKTYMHVSISLKPIDHNVVKRKDSDVRLDDTSIIYDLA